MTDYNDGKWHGWNGGECPVHPQSEIEVVYANAIAFSGATACTAKYAAWSDKIMQLAAFRVVTPYDEPVEYTGECNAYHHIGQAPALVSLAPRQGIIAGRYTATHINGKLARIVWESTE